LINALVISGFRLLALEEQQEKACADAIGRGKEKQTFQSIKQIGKGADIPSKRATNTGICRACEFTSIIFLPCLCVIVSAFRIQLGPSKYTHPPAFYTCPVLFKIQRAPLPSSHIYPVALLSVFCAYPPLLPFTSNGRNAAKTGLLTSRK